MLVTRVFSFSHNVFKEDLLRVVKGGLVWESVNCFQKKINVFVTDISIFDMPFDLLNDHVNFTKAILVRNRILSW